MQNRALSFFRWNIDFVVHFLLNTLYRFITFLDSVQEVLNLTLESLDGWGVGLGGRGEAGEGSLKKRRVMKVRGSKSGDNFNKASLVEHLQRRGRSFHQVPEQVKSLD